MNQDPKTETVNTPGTTAAAPAPPKPKRTTVLVIEDNPMDFKMIQKLLSAASGAAFELDHAERLDAGLARLAQDGIDLVLLDLSLPDSHGLETFASVHRHAPQIPIIVLTGLDDETTALKAFHQGAQDYLIKGRVDTSLLLRAIYYAIERKKTETALADERNLLRTIIDMLPNNIFVKDTQSRFVLNNLAHLRLLGAAQPEEVLGKTDLDYFPKELALQYRADEEALLRSGQPLVAREEPVVDPQGRRHWVVTTKVPLKDSSGKIIGLVGINQDITERKHMEEQLKRAYGTWRKTNRP